MWSLFNSSKETNEIGDDTKSIILFIDIPFH